MIFFGAFRNGWEIGRLHIFQIATVLALWGVVLSTVYMLRAYRQTFMGNIREQWQKLPDLRPALRVPVMLLVAPLLCCGFFPQFFVRMVAPTFRTSLSTNTSHSTNMQRHSHGAVSANGAEFIASLGQAPQDPWNKKMSALKARLVESRLQRSYWYDRIPGALPQARMTKAPLAVDRYGAVHRPGTAVVLRKTSAAASLQRSGNQMTSITAPLLEIAVLVLGMLILMIEAFAGKIDKRVLAYAAITGLALVLLASFFVAPFPSPSHATGFWSFYTADRLAIFFKQFALVTTIFVVIMMIDYAPVVRGFFPGAAPQTGLGEFVALPLFTCAGLMYLVSAIDFVFIFVSLELVTVSFYVLVSFTRRNPATLEAGTKYLVLSALSTGFLVYGIAWIFGATGQTNLYRLTAALANPGSDSGAACWAWCLFWLRSVSRSRLCRSKSGCRMFIKVRRRQ